MTSTTLRSIELRCPNCGNEFLSKSLQSDDVAGRQHTDLHVQAEGRQPLRYWVHQCLRCGFAARAEAFSNVGDVSYEVRQHVWDELTPRLSGAPLAPSEKYEFAAKVRTWDSGDPMRVGELWLRAGWCAMDEGDIEAERYYRRYAASSFEEALGTFDGVDAEERAKITYLVGELWRRIGDQARANMWFARVPDEAIREGDQTWVRWADRQRENPAEWFA